MKTSTGLSFSKTKSFGNSGNIGLQNDKFNYTSTSGNTHLGNKTMMKSSSKLYYLILNYKFFTESFQQTKGPENKVEEDYITNLQKQVYYLELEMKLMKDREIDTKNKVGGYGK